MIQQIFLPPNFTWILIDMREKWWNKRQTFHNVFQWNTIQRKLSAANNSHNEEIEYTEREREKYRIYQIHFLYANSSFVSYEMEWKKARKGIERARQMFEVNQHQENYIGITIISIAMGRFMWIFFSLSLHFSFKYERRLFSLKREASNPWRYFCASDDDDGAAVLHHPCDVFLWEENRTLFIYHLVVTFS